MAQITDYELELKEAFTQSILDYHQSNQADKELNPEIHIDQLHDVLKRLGQYVTKQQLREYREDKELVANNGMINYNQFKKYFMERKLESYLNITKEDLQCLQKDLSNNTQQDGKINVKMFKHLMINFGNTKTNPEGNVMTKNDVEQIVRQLAIVKSEKNEKGEQEEYFKIVDLVDLLNRK